MTVQVLGIAELQRKLRSLGDAMDDAIMGGVMVTANEIRTDAIKSIQQVSGGQQVQRSRQGGGGTYTHTASSEGNAPNTDTGKLVASIAVENNKTGMFSLVGSNLDYATFLEFGTRSMGARPFLQPALDKNEENLKTNISKAADVLIERRSR